MRATPRPADVQQLEEGQDRVDEGGDLTLPADETLADLADVELSPEEQAEEEVQEQAGPLAASEAFDLELDE